ncbi:6-hydroxymethylpterin diphosphokinase MptE-like protein [Lysinibacillus sp.]|uniref:motility associated factor glycosyltransferase family protein n=1 Tax=Lysinibacillus sp. TaxID=1869345 RepID=UPI00289717C0|nr:6-hydroxymethylpterin diphosphokinase MptE-like protein [Lysinibacillus sp.]
MFEKNIEVLKYNDKHYVADLQNIFEYPKFISKKYSRETFQLADGEVYLSKIEMDQSVEISNLKKEVIFVFGINAVEEIQWIQQNKHCESIIIIIEPNPSFFSYVVQQKDLGEVFKESNVLLFVDNNIGNLNIFLQKVFYDFNYLKYLKNTNVYLTHYYRVKGLQTAKEMLSNIRQIISTLLFSLGNDLEDNLIGLERNFNNIDNIIRSKDILAVKDIFKGVPAVVVAAGPSLNNNIEDLKKNKDKVIVIAVDTIAQKLITEGIEPHFICSIERVHQVYDYFYADVQLPEKSIIVGPPVLDNRIFENTNNAILIPFRKGVSETNWLQKLLGLSNETAISMGYSCANIAFSLGCYLGCNPVILVGQDLAYGESEKETHASGTKYDELNESNKKIDEFELTLGYYGKPVKTTKIWLQFKHWLESEINSLSTTVINATEGGAKINFAKQLSLKEATANYCQKDIPDIHSKMKKVPMYSISKEQYFANLIEEINLYEEIKNKSIHYQKILNAIKPSKDVNNLLKLSEDFQIFLNGVVSQPLLLHNLQSVVLQYYWAYNGRLQIMDQEYVKQEIFEQQKLLTTIIEVINRILAILKTQKIKKVNI